MSGKGTGVVRDPPDRAPLTIVCPFSGAKCRRNFFVLEKKPKKTGIKKNWESQHLAFENREENGQIDSTKNNKKILGFSVSVRGEEGGERESLRESRANHSEGTTMPKRHSGFLGGGGGAVTVER